MEFVMQYNFDDVEFAVGQQVQSPIKDTRNITMNFEGMATVQQVVKKITRHVVTTYVIFNIPD